MATLPPDLDRLGQQLAGAAGSTLAARRRRAERRRRVTGAAVIGALAFAVLNPGPLDDGVRDVARTKLAGAGFGPPECDHPRGARFTLPRCEEPMILHRPYASR